MSLRSKIIWIFCSLFTMYGAIVYVVQKKIITPHFHQIEKEAVNVHIMKIKEIIESEIYHLDKLNHDWSAWDDTYKYVDNFNQEYEKSNLVYNTLKTSRINLLYIYDKNGRIIWGETYNTIKNKKINIEGGPGKLLQPGDPLIDYSNQGRDLNAIHVKGIIKTSHGPLLISSRPILTSKNNGPQKGYILMGRLLDKYQRNVLLKRTKFKFELMTNTHDQFQKIFSKISEADERRPIFEISQNKEIINCYLLLKDIAKEPTFIIKLEYPRNILTSVMKSVQKAYFIIIISSFIILLTAFFIIVLTITHPINLLKERITAIVQLNNYSERTAINSYDEIGSLSKIIDKLISRLEHAAVELRTQAALDPLTHLLNRKTFDILYDKEWRRMAREKQHLTVILIDIDYFKKYNDYYGHHEGDKCLKKVAKIIADQLKRGGDLVARYKDQEFIAVLPNTKYDGAIHIADQIKKAIYDLKIPNQESEIESYITCSLGLSTLIPSRETSKLFLAKSADEALYMAKHSGKNKIVGIYEGYDFGPIDQK